jgi:uncharacterized protein YcbK (DUF882 family)
VNLSRNFSREEFACKCGCGFDTVDVELLSILQRVRDHFAVPVTITSGCRCPTHNRAVNGAPDSWHMKGRAADIQVHGVLAAVVADYLHVNYPDRFGIERHRSFTHFDTRSGAPFRKGF